MFSRRRSFTCVFVILCCVVGFYTVFNYTVSTFKPNQIQNQSISDGKSSIHFFKKIQTGDTTGIIKLREAIAKLNKPDVEIGGQIHAGRLVPNGSVDQTHVTEVTNGSVDLAHVNNVTNDSVGQTHVNNVTNGNVDQAHVNNVTNGSVDLAHVNEVTNGSVDLAHVNNVTNGSVDQTHVNEVTNGSVDQAHVNKVTNGSVDQAHVNNVTNGSVDQAHVNNVTKGALDDYKKFPCVSGIVPSQGLTQYGSCVRTISQDVNEDAVNVTCVPLKIMLATPICVYESKTDKWVSGSIIKTGQFEGGMVRGLMTILTTNPKLEFLDLGCNIGTYTLTAAKLGKRVVCVDPMTQNIRMVSKSLNLGKIRDNVTLIWNAVSDYYSVVSFKKEIGNVGGTAIKSFDNTVTVNDNDAARTIRLDDLRSLFQGKQIVIKMDVETQELAILKGGKEFFNDVDVRLIQMEFNFHKKDPSGREIIDIMEERLFLPFRDPFGTIALDKTKYSAWPGDMYFVKKTV